MKACRRQLVCAAFASILLLAPPMVAAALFKCVDTSGKTRFSDRPCRDGETLETLPEHVSKSAGSAAKTQDQQREGLGRYIDRAKQVSPAGGSEKQR